ncbi:hypothetical protein ACQEVC_11645 [Plantactinospora sp. CA-294935]|uniref:hypothetical protein n=1 Tax=Plantactinospora sp. CA-294935 TaxID=3240012 RepID=UPI003D92C45D
MDVAGQAFAKRLREAPESARRAFSAAVCEAALSRVGLTHQTLLEAVEMIRSDAVPESRHAVVAAIVRELDVAAWDLGSGGGEAYLVAFRRARAAAAVEEACRETVDAALDAAYEARHAGLGFAEIERLLVAS